MSFYVDCFESYSEPEGVIEVWNIPPATRCTYLIGPLEGASITLFIEIVFIKYQDGTDICEDYVKVYILFMSHKWLIYFETNRIYLLHCHIMKLQMC